MTQSFWKREGGSDESAVPLSTVIEYRSAVGSYFLVTMRCSTSPE
jgi:hypothetical protein